MADELSTGQRNMIRKAFEAFETEHKKVATHEISTIFDMMGIKQSQTSMINLINEFDPWGSNEVDYEAFEEMVARFLMPEENPEKMQQELREAFRLYDKEGNGYITTEVMREILAELDETMSDDDLDQIIDEIDADGSGTVDFQEFMEVMTGGDD